MASAALALPFALGEEAAAQPVVVYAGNSQPTTSSFDMRLRIGVNNTGVTGQLPSIWNTNVACLTDELEGGVDLDGDGFLNSVVAQIVDVDKTLVTNTRLKGIPINTTAITQITPAAGVYAAWISQEAKLLNLPFPNTGGSRDVNGDGDEDDWVVVLHAYRNPAPPAVSGDTWIFGPAPSAGFPTGFYKVHLSGQIMVIEQTNFLPGAALPIFVLDLQGFGSPGISTGMLLPEPNAGYTAAAAGFNPVANFSSAIPFPSSQYIAFEQSEGQLAADLNGDGDLCDRAIAYQEILGDYIPCPGPFCPGWLPVYRLMSPVCLVGTGVANKPSARPDAFFGDRIGFGVLPPALQPTLGPDCPATNNSPFRGRVQTAAACAGSGYFLDAITPGDQISVAGRVYSGVFRENAPNVSHDINADGFRDFGVVVWSDQQVGLPKWRVTGPGVEPAAENNFTFVLNPPPAGPLTALIAYTGREDFNSTGDLNGDGDEFDHVILVGLQ